jgi:DASS family divalent anion:Na+ symporter
MAAFFIARALIKTGLARRIALLFVRIAGRTSLGVCYALSFSDMLLATVIPSNAARSGGVTLPIVRSLCELYGSLPGRTAALLGAFLMTAVYQNVCVTAAMFLTGQASNPVAAKAALDTLHYQVTWVGWALACVLPGLCSLAIVPLVVYRLNPPQIRRTPEAPVFAARELDAMGPMKRQEVVALAVFVAVCAGWVTSPLHGLEISITALAGVAALLVTGVLNWEDVKNEKAAWDIFVWYGGLLMLGQALNDKGLTNAFAKAVAAQFGYLGWPALFAIALLVYFYAHYGFASITTHIVAMFMPFVAVLVAMGAPKGWMVFAFACFANDVLRARLRQPGPVVEGGRGGFSGEHRHLVHGRLPVVESTRAVVAAAGARPSRPGRPRPRARSRSGPPAAPRRKRCATVRRERSPER